MSGGEPSSIKRCTRCAVSQPVLSNGCVCRVGVTFDLRVYGLTLQLVFIGWEVAVVHKALYRKWRPQTFDDVCGQEHITSILKYEASEGSFNHAYLFCGSRGTGKTTCAKILAKVINCENPKDGNPCGECAACRSIDDGSATDVLEMDAASNNKVEHIRDIRDEVVYPPTHLKYRVYIVDEVHMLTDSAFNALLKTLEEPPSYVVFILATTELHELPATIISRCQRFEFRRIAVDILTARLEKIAEAEGIDIERGALQLLAKLAQGGMRDAISLLDLCSGGCRDRRIDEDIVNEIVGISSRSSLEALVNAIADKEYEVIFREIDNVVRSSKDISVFWQNLLSFYRDMLVMKTSSNAAKYLDLTDNEQKQLERTAARFSRETILAHCKLLEGALFAIQKVNAVKRTVAELTLIKMCDETLVATNENLLSRISKLEDSIALGLPVRESAKPSAAEETPVTSPAPAEKKAAPAVEKKVAPEEKKVLKYLSSWTEVIERVAKIQPSNASYLKQAKAYADPDGNIRILVPDPFTLMMIQRGDIRNQVRAALSVCLKREISEAALIIEGATTDLPTDDGDLLLDEIIKNAT